MLSLGCILKTTSHSFKPNFNKIFLYCSILSFSVSKNPSSDNGCVIIKHLLFNTEIFISSKKIFCKILMSESDNFSNISFLEFSTIFLFDISKFALSLTIGTIL